jgi:hypothetical protein
MGMGIGMYIAPVGPTASMAVFEEEHINASYIVLH